MPHLQVVSKRGKTNNFPYKVYRNVAGFTFRAPLLEKFPTLEIHEAEVENAEALIRYPDSNEAIREFYISPFYQTIPQKYFKTQNETK